MSINMIELDARHMVHIFKGRTDRVVLFAKGREIFHPLKRADYELITRMEAHLQGTDRVAFYNHLDDNTIPWGVINFQEGGPSQNVAADSVLLAREIRKLGIRSVRRERTMLPQEEYNVWLFFQNPIPAKKFRHFIFTLFDKIGLSRKIPVIPSSDELTPGSFGQHVWIPFFNGVDKWMDEQSGSYVCQGMKGNQTVFVDDEGNPIEQFVLEIPRNEEIDIDRALMALDSELGKKYVPGEGISVLPSTFRKMLDGCVAFNALVKEIEEKNTVSEEGLVRLAAMLKGMGLDELLQGYLSRVTGFNEKKFERALAKYHGQVFPLCIDMKQVGFCPPNKQCFMRRLPLKEKMGFWTEDKTSKIVIEPNVGLWLHRVVVEQVPEAPAPVLDLGDEDLLVDDLEMESPASDTGEPAASAEVISAEDFVDKYEEAMQEKAGGLIPGEGAPWGFGTGLDSLNEAIEGLGPGTLTTLAGPPGGGKSTLAKQILDTVADKEKVPCLYVSYDLSLTCLHQKSLSRLSGVPLPQVQKNALSDEEKAKLDKVNAYFKETLGKLIFMMEADQKTGLPAIEKAVRDTGARFVVVDFIQAIPLGSRLAVLDADARTRVILGQLKQAARREDIPVMAICNSPITDGISYSSDLVLQLYTQSNPAAASPDRQAQAAVLNVEKNRLGRSLISIQLTFFPPRMVFYGDKKIDYRPIKF